MYTSSLLPAWLQSQVPWQRKVITVDQLQMSTIDFSYPELSDKANVPVVLLLHGNPTWGYLWRKIIDGLTDLPIRIVAPDLIGLGFSGKPNIKEHTLANHRRWMVRFVEQLNLQNILLVAQDWGGPIGAATAAQMPERFKAAIFGNTALLKPRAPVRQTLFHRFARLPLASEFSFLAANLPVHLMHLAQHDRRSIGPEEKKAYAFPLSSYASRSASLGMARMVPDTIHHPSMPILEEIEQWARQYQKDFTLIWGTKDPVLGTVIRRLKRELAEAKVIECEAGHFLQEEVPQLFVQEIRAKLKQF